MKTWFITGISRGLGLALAQAALGRGDRVVGTTRDGTAPEGLSAEGLTVLALDVVDGAAVKAAVADSFRREPRIDVIVNNAGYGLLGAFEQAEDAALERLFAVNLWGPLNVIRAALPYLRAQGGGHIVNVTSIAGRAPGAGSAAYAAAKSAIEGLTQALALEVGALGIRVTAVAPGAFRTDFLSEHSIRRSGLDEAYAGTVGPVMHAFDAMAGSQLGDPEAAAAAMLALVDAPQPPQHLLLGSDALRRYRERMETVLAEVDAWESVTRSTDFAA